MTSEVFSRMTAEGLAVILRSVATKDLLFARERAFDHNAMQKIEAHSPAYSKVHAAKKPA
ncbi:MAG: hypothetical protein A3J28_01375 [Acidobacteria bacterium RIFCSPLOWO2_12_FULL_60_22]|nr:MAG: hypothetical protein A3J28_01375 [Acidobacteria bacterium RIFCSPLOWO2_12_FULL_60_22]